MVTQSSDGGRRIRQRVSVGELVYGHFSVGELDLATLANAWHNVEAGCRHHKRIMTLQSCVDLSTRYGYLFFERV